MLYNKGKAHKGREFGRQFQIGRIAGNFVYSIPNDSLRMPDAASLKSLLIEHIHTFQAPLDSFAADKGYYSKDNERLLLAFKIQDVGLQKPLRKLEIPPDNPIGDSRREELSNRRRAGIEPIISHLKRHWQMGRSRMKSDTTMKRSDIALY